MAALFPWPGAKRRLAKTLLPLIENTPHRCYCEPFAGSAALLFARQKPAPAEVLNDVNRDLVNFFRVVAHHPEELARQLRWAFSSRVLFQVAKDVNPDCLTDVQRAARFFYLQRLSFGGKVTSRTYGTSTTSARFDVKRLGRVLDAAHLRMASATIECLPWQDCMARYDREHTLFFADPPYYGLAGYSVEFGVEQYEQLAEVMAKSKGKVILTVNDHPRMQRTFKRFRMQTVDISYTLAGASKPKRAKELVVFGGRR